MDDLSKYYPGAWLGSWRIAGEGQTSLSRHGEGLHPDRFAHDERLRLLAQDKLKQINGAYETLKAHAFEASIAPEPAATPKTETAAAAPPPARNRAALWTTVGVLLLVLVAAAAFLFHGTGRGKMTAVSPKAAPAIVANSPPPTNAPSALSFNGNHGQLAIATTGSLTGTFTVELWALTRKSQSGTILSSSASDNCGLDIKFRLGRWFHTDLGDGSRWLARNANARIRYQADTWYHLAYVATPTNYNIYINGALTGSGPIEPPGNPLLYDANHQLLFGTEKLASDDLDGCLAEIRVWGVARTQTQIESNMSHALNGDEPGLMGYWRLAEGSGTVAADSSGHGFTGTLTGDVLVEQKHSACHPPLTLERFLSKRNRCFIKLKLSCIRPLQLVTTRRDSTAVAVAPASSSR